MKPCACSSGAGQKRDSDEFRVALRRLVDATDAAVAARGYSWTDVKTVGVFVEALNDARELLKEAE